MMADIEVKPRRRSVQYHYYAYVGGAVTMNASSSVANAHCLPCLVELGQANAATRKAKVAHQYST